MSLYIANAITDILEILVFLLGSYYLVIAFFSFFSFRKSPNSRYDFSFAVLIPAHNEEKVIAELIESIKSNDYPPEKVDIFVIADGCTDNTARIAKMHGAEIILKDMPSTKGAAIEYALELKNNFSSYDCITVFDADNIADKNYFREMSEKLSGGFDVVQGYVDSKNPYASWVSNAHSLWYWITNRVFQKGRDELSIGCRLNGTGFAIRQSVLSTVPWKVKTLAEDAEYTCMLEEAGIRVAFAAKAAVYDEKPVTFAESVNQRTRWAHGMSSVQGEYSYRFIKSGRINAFLCLWSDVLSIFAFTVLLFSKAFGIGKIWQTTVGSVTVLVYIFSFVATAVIALIKDKKMSKKIILNIFGFLIYLISWFPIGLFNLIGTQKLRWHHTEHTNYTDL